MKKREIGVAFYDLHLNSTTRARDIESPSCATMSDILDGMNTMLAKHRPRFHKDKKTILIDVMDWHHDKKRGQYHMLVNRANSDVPDIALKDFATRKTRFAGKTATEGVDVSTHIIITPGANARTAGLLVTQGAGMGIALLEKIFGGLATELEKRQIAPHLFEFGHPAAAQGKTYRVHYGFQCVGQKSQTLASDLAAGELLGIELINEATTSFDSGGNLRLESTSVKLAPMAPDMGTLRKLTTALRNGMRERNERYDSVRVSFKDHSNKNRTEQFSLNALEEAFVRREYLDFSTDIQSSYQRLSADIIPAMQALI